MQSNDRVEELEGLVADLGMEIAVLKQQRARLWLELRNVCDILSLIDAPAHTAAAQAALDDIPIDE